MSEGKQSTGITWRGRKGSGVWGQLDRWRGAARELREVAAEQGGEFVFTNSAGDECRVDVHDVIGWRRLVAGLLREARRRQRLGDEAWFRWMDEYGDMIFLTEWDTTEALYDPPLERLARAMDGRRKATEAATQARRAKGEETAKRVREGERTIVDKRHQRRILRGK